MGLNEDPRRAPQFKTNGSEINGGQETVCCLSDRKECRHLRADLLNQNLESLGKRTGWDSVSNAALRPKRTRAAKSPLSRIICRSSVMARRADSVLWAGLHSPIEMGQAKNYLQGTRNLFIRCLF